MNGILEAYDRSPLSARYWLCVTTMAFAALFEFFDFFLAGFLVAVVGKDWGLTYGESSIILLCGGLGAMAGAATFGLLADQFGRKRLFVSAVVLCGLSAGSVAFLPDGGWRLFSALRFLTGFGMGAATVASLPMIVEMTPTRHRTVITGILAIPVSLGILAASAIAAWLLPEIGWRGVAALGFAPLLPAVVVALMLPESVRWLVAKGRFSEARRALRVIAPRAELLLQDAVADAAPASAAGDFRELLSDRRRLLLTVIMWFSASTATYGVLLWGPTIVAELLKAPAAEAAKVFVWVSIVGIVGRVCFSLAPYRLGRRRCGEIMGYGTAVTLALAGFFHAETINGVPLFIPLVVLAAFFFDGGFSNIAPYSAEIFPVRLAARGVALAQISNGLGKIAGPVTLAFIAGLGATMSGTATAAAATQVFLFLAACGLAVGLSFSVLGIETHGRALSLGREPTGSAS